MIVQVHRKIGYILATFLLTSYLLYSLVAYKDSHTSSVSRPPRLSREGPFRGYKDCNPEMDIVFHKTHKCSSSTVQNILLRYAHQHELNVVLPKSGNYLGRKSLFRTELLLGTPWQQAGLHYNLFCLHNRWNGAEVEKLFGRMKNQRPIYFTILRDPIELYISLWDYLDLGSTYGGISLEKYALSDKSGLLADRAHQQTMGRNNMMWDFGLDPIQFTNETAIEAKIGEIEDTFDLVLITEQFQESMVLLKNLLCWDYADVTSLKLNSHDLSTKSTLSKEARKAMKEWLSADYQLYDHFYAKFQRELENFGPDRLKHELEILSHANQEVREHCVIAQVSNEVLSPHDRLAGHGVLAYKINTEYPECQFMGMKERNFLEIIREKQTRRSEEASGLKFDKIEANLEPLGPHISIEQMESMFRHRGP